MEVLVGGTKEMLALKGGLLDPQPRPQFGGASPPPNLASLA